MFTYTLRPVDPTVFNGTATTDVDFKCDECGAVVKGESSMNANSLQRTGNAGVMRAREAMMLGQQLQREHRKACKGKP